MNARELVGEIVERVLPSLNDETPLQSLAGWDSLKMVHLVVRLEGVLDRELSEQELEELNTIGHVERLLAVR